jgi:hypothetical protein
LRRRTVGERAARRFLEFFAATIRNGLPLASSTKQEHIMIIGKFTNASEGCRDRTALPRLAGLGATS